MILVVYTHKKKYLVLGGVPETVAVRAIIESR